MADERSTILGAMLDLRIAVGDLRAALDNVDAAIDKLMMAEMQIKQDCRYPEPREGGCASCPDSPQDGK